MNPKYPVYIISKGRWESRLTSKALEYMNVPYFIVIEPQEYEDYADVIDPQKILTLPFSNLGQGSIPARNWVWEHSIERGAKRHWLLDDNIGMFYRFNNNLTVPVTSGTIFRATEDFIDRYSNIAIAGLEYYMFISRKSKTTPYRLNTRIYSCSLIKNDLPYRWRGRYNEDTDLCLRMLKGGWSTILFHAFLAHKTTTMTMKGGNTDEVYTDGDERMKFAESLQKQHPDVVEIVRKFHRWHHQVDYSGFRKNHLIRVDNYDEIVKKGVNNYGMVLRHLEED